jgi:hypothetical protein
MAIVWYTVFSGQRLKTNGDLKMKTKQRHGLQTKNASSVSPFDRIIRGVFFYLAAAIKRSNLLLAEGR